MSIKGNKIYSLSRKMHLCTFKIHVSLFKALSLDLFNLKPTVAEPLNRTVVVCFVPLFKKIATWETSWK